MAIISFGSTSVNTPCSCASQADVDEIRSLLSELFVTCSSQSGDIVVPANGRKNVQFSLAVPDGYTAGAYRQVAFQGSGRDSCAIQSFATADGGKKANISLKNFTNTDATVNIGVVVLAYKVIA